MHRDLDNYLPVELDLQQRNWVRARKIVQRTTFETQIFQDWVGLITREQLPTDIIMKRYDQALSDWQQGNTERALAELEGLAGERWGEDAERSLQHRHQVISDFSQLRQTRGKVGYDRQLLSFYRTLDPVEDVYFTEAIAEELQLYRNKALDDAARQYKTAAESWKEYLAGGGIRGLHRLEARISETYRRQAARLSAAYNDMSKSMEIHKLLKTNAGQEQDEQGYHYVAL